MPLHHAPTPVPCAQRRWANPVTLANGRAAQEFNARRFHDLRTSSTPDPLKYSTREQYQFVTATKEFMAFGYGRHACPGRFFAANEIKLILSRLLLEYDLRMPDGLTERYPNMVMGIDALPDPTKELMLKRVST